MSTFSNFMELGTLFCYLLVLFWPKEVCEGQKIKAEFLSRGTKRFYFNSCSCGLLEVNEQDISSDWAKEKNALIEKNLRNLFKSRRRRKREAEQSAKSIRINLSLTINMDSKDGNFSGNIVANPEKVRSKHILRTMDHLMLDEYSVEMEAVSPESLESLGPNWRNMGSQDKNYTTPVLKLSHKVINGIVAERGQAPWQVLLENMNSGEICGGAIVNARFILTAAHCTVSFEKQGTRPLRYPANILDWWEKSFINENVFIAGYGRTTKQEISGQDTTSCVLKLGKTSIISSRDSKCSAVSSNPREQICGWDPEVDACSGDSGGPMSIKSQFENRIQIGVVSYGSFDCAHSRAAGVYSRITRVMRWIVAKIQSGECIQ
ncbi:transmembrane protease serine 9-like isoform X2 [Tigriopus californicus]|uniref:transmembrane protease serine 9-like isoform X2 n=1 Tax=Tigriopus californicus TaxID=6832 RepID=UPI0027DA1E16|nr:transmembrane protease serine 9-like isoform X2 [Tigriopus californicus]